MPVRTVILLILASLLVGCTSPASARFEVSGVDPAYRECFDAAFPFVPIFHAYRERAGSVGLFFQSRGGSVQFTDVVYMEIFEPESIEEGTPIEIDRLVTPDTRVAATIELQESCPVIGILAITPKEPGLKEVPVIRGTVTFDQFSQEIDGVIAGRIDGSLEDATTGTVAASSFTGEFDFTVQVGQPYEEFRN